MYVLAFVEGATNESEGLLGLEPTREELKDQFVVAVDALSVPLPPTSSARVTALDLDQMVHSHVNERLIEEASNQISSWKIDFEKAKEAWCDCQRTHETHDGCGWLWNASHVVIPLLNDADLPPDSKGLQTLFVAFQSGSLAADGSNTDSGGLMQDETKDQSDRLRSHRRLLESASKSGSVGNEEMYDFFRRDGDW